MIKGWMLVEKTVFIGCPCPVVPEIEQKTPDRGAKSALPCRGCHNPVKYRYKPPSVCIFYHHYLLKYSLSVSSSNIYFITYARFFDKKNLSFRERKPDQGHLLGDYYLNGGI
jgi:hypothetical protein